MIKNYDIEFSKGFREFHKSVRETEKRLSDMIDNVMVWLLSLSTGAIVLLISSDTSSFTDKKGKGVIVVLLTISVLAGIIGRVAHTISVYINNQLSDHLEAAFMANEAPLYNPYQLRGDETAEEVYYLLKTSFDLDLPALIEPIKDLTPEQILLRNQQAKDLYEQIKVSVKEDQQEALARVVTKMNKTLGIDGKKQKGDDENTSKRKRMWATLLENSSYILLSLAAIMFIAALIFSVIKFLEH